VLKLRSSYFYADCGQVVVGETEEDLMAAAAEPGRSVHGENPANWTPDEFNEMRSKIESD